MASSLALYRKDASPLVTLTGASSLHSPLKSGSWGTMDVSVRAGGGGGGPAAARTGYELNSNR